MRTIFRTVVRAACSAGLSACLVLGGLFTPLLAQAQEVDILVAHGITLDGRWEAFNHESRYEMSLCGDGSQLCAKLVWIEPDKINGRNSQYIDEYVVFEARRARPFEWRGDINIYGTIYGGSVKVINRDELLITGCIFILCETYELYRMQADQLAAEQVAEEQAAEEQVAEVTG